MVARKRTPAKSKPPAKTDATVVVKKSAAPTWVMVAIAAAAFGYYVFRSERGRSPQPEPQPKPASVEQVAKDAMKGLASGYSKSFSDAAVLVLEGKIKTDSELFKELKPANDKARSAAFAAMDKLIQDSLPRDSDRLKPESADFLESIGKAYGKAVR